MWASESVGMSEKMKRISVDLDSETAQLVESAAARKGVSVEQFCAGAVHNELSQETTGRKFSAEGMITAGEAIFRGKLSVTDSADLIREAREERHRNL